MGQVVLSLPSDGTTIDASDVNTPLNTLVNEFNGNIDDNNIKTGANISGAKLNDASIPGKKFDSTTYGGWVAGVLPAVSSVTCNGNRSYDVVFNSTVASYLTPGMRIRTTRTVAAPTQCTSLNGTTQYWSRASGSLTGTLSTFTDDFTVSAWIKLSSYTAADQTIISRYNGTSGWIFKINGTSGVLSLTGYSGGAVNYRQVTSYQSVPLNKWVHVSASLDMSGFTTTTNKIMIDGVDVPAYVGTGGTNPTSLTQAGNLEVGTYNASAFFGGKIAQVAVFNGNVSTVTQSTLRGYMSQTLSGSETSCIFFVSFNNSTTDLSSSANTLSAGAGSPTATNADSPFTTDANGTPGGSYDYAIVQKVSTTTATVQVPEGCTIPTSGGVSAVDLSAWKAPFGMPVAKGKWRVQTIYKARLTQSSPTQNTWYNLSTTSGTTQSGGINIPVGDWNYGYEAVVYNDRGAAGATAGYATLSTTTNSETDAELTGTSSAGTATSTAGTIKREKELSLSAATVYYLNAKTDAAGTSTLILFSDIAVIKIYADPSHL